jgi:signal transduction histidine kinase
MKDDFFAFAAHEVRSPLATVTGFARWMQRRATTQRDRFDGDERDALDALAIESQRVAATIDVFLDLTRIQSERLAMDATDVDVGAAVRQEVVRLQASHPEAKVSLQTPPGPLVGRLDADRLRQVLGNLLTNAIKYGGAPPAVSVEVTPVHPGVVITVEDNGTGIADADRPHIFERFYRSAGASVTTKRGLGVGLYIAHQIVHRMGGTLTFQPAGGGGTRFVLTLPLPRSEAADVAVGT